MNPVTSYSPIVCRSVIPATPAHLDFILAPVRSVIAAGMPAAVTQRLEIAWWVNLSIAVIMLFLDYLWRFVWSRDVQNKIIQNQLVGQLL